MDQWKLLRVEQLLDALSNSIPAPTVVFHGSRTSAQQQPQQQPQVIGDGESVDPALAPLGPLHQFQTRGSAAADAAPVSLGAAGVDTLNPIDPSESFFVPVARPSSPVQVHYGTTSAQTEAARNGPALRSDQLAGIVFGTKAHPSGAGPPPSAAAPYYGGRVRGGTGSARPSSRQRERPASEVEFSGDQSADSNQQQVQPPPQRRLAAGSEEVAEHMPVHSQSGNDFEWKRVENTRWNNLRGMWGKRSMM